MGRTKDNRSPYWAMIIYPDSFPSWGYDFLRSFGLPIYVSPLHDADYWDFSELAQHVGSFAVEEYLNACAFGQPVPRFPKKPHYHVLVSYGKRVELSQVNQDFKYLWPLPQQYERIGNYKQYARYLCHLDTPAKASYAPEDVQSFNCANYREAFCTAKDLVIDAQLQEILDFVYGYKCVSFAVLADLIRKDRPDLFNCLMHNSNTILKIQKSICAGF